MCLAFGQAHAGSVPGVEIGSFEFGQSSIPVLRIGEVVSAAPDMDSFAVEVAYSLRDFTARQGVEACAKICRTPDGTRWGATLVTIGSRAACPRTDACPDDMVSTEVDIHSHLHVSRYRPSGLDQLFLTRRYGPGDFAFTIPDRFSPVDFDGGKGYMVSKELLLYQDGPRNVRRVRDMKGALPPSRDGGS